MFKIISKSLLTGTILLVNTFITWAFTGELTVKAYSGSINNKYNISMVLYTYTLGTYNRLVGYYYYNSNKQPIFIDGLKEADKFTVNEYLDNGKLNATFEGYIQGGKISGKWKMGAKVLPFQLNPVNDPAVSIHISPKSFPAGTYNLKWTQTEGSITTSKNTFNFDLVALPSAHTGNLEAQWQVHATGIAYYFVNEDIRALDVNCLFFFIPFSNKLFVFQVGKPEYFDFGQGVSAQGVYKL